MVSGEPDPARAAGARRLPGHRLDHGMNASTFTARVVASTGSDDGLGGGGRHRRAEGSAAWRRARAGAGHARRHRQPERAAAWLEAELGRGRAHHGHGPPHLPGARPPGRGAGARHRAARAARDCATSRLALARAVERAAEGLLRQRYPDRPLRANVEFYTAVLLDAVGLARTLFSAAFAVAAWPGGPPMSPSSGLPDGSSAPPRATWGPCRAE